MVKKSDRTGKISKTALLAGAALALPVASKAGVVFVDSGFNLSSTSSATPTTDSAFLTIGTTNILKFTANGSTSTGEDTVTAVAAGSGWVGDTTDPYYLPAAAPLAFGTDIGASMNSTYSFYGTSTGAGILQKVYGDPSTTAQKGPWPTDGSSAYLGFEFDGTDSMLHYGWVQVSACVPDKNTPCTDPAATLTVDSYAYQSTPNTDIFAGQTSSTPEPSTLTLFALGAAGLAAFRLRKRAA
jgi:PEP-CTERM motif